MNEIKEFVQWAKDQGAIKIKAEGFADGSDLVKVEVEFRQPTLTETTDVRLGQIDDEFNAMMKDLPEDERKALEIKRRDALLYGSS